jgi:hypothetical protein
LNAGVGMRQEHERGLAEFLKPVHRARFRESLARDRSRKKLQREFAHFEHRLDERYAEHQEMHTKHDEHVALVHERLVEAGAPDRCFVLVDDDRLACETPLNEAIADLMSVGSGFISCVPARLGVYVGEDGSNVFILRRRP